MEKKKGSCNCIYDCPCYPRCDAMMEQEEKAWEKSAQEEKGGSAWEESVQAEDRYRMQPQMISDETPGMDAEERDWQRLKELYPDMAKILLGEVEEVCDRMEYEGSMMFDVIPEKQRVWDMTEEIVERVQDRIPGQEKTEEDGAEVTRMERRCRKCRPGQEWLGDFIEVLLYHEMYHRRRRHRGYLR